MESSSHLRKLRSIDDLQRLSQSANHILTLFSGGLDSTYILQLLSGGNAKVTALAVDLGDNIDGLDLGSITDRFGYDLHIADARREFVQSSLLPAIQSQARYFGDYPVSSSLSRPVIVRLAADLAHELGCDAIVHSATQSQNSLRRINGAIEASSFSGYYGSPYEYSPVTRAEKTEALRLGGLGEFKKRCVSGDSNIWCREFESGVLSDPEAFDIPPSLFKWAKWCPEKHVARHRISIDFEQGKPVALNDHPCELIDIIENLNHSMGAYEIGRYVGFDHLQNDEKVLEVREAPAATVLMQAYRLLESAILPTDVLLAKAAQNDIWTQEAVAGRWNSPLQKSSYAFIANTATAISGKIVFSLSRGSFLPASIVAQNPAYLRDRDAWEVRVADAQSRRSLIIPKRQPGDTRGTIESVDEQCMFDPEVELS